MNLVYILVDFENVQPTAVDIGLIRGADCRVQLFYGPHQNKFDADVVRALHALGNSLEYVQCERRGKNALDFHIAFCLGRLVQQRDSEAALHEHTRFVIVSKDTGFDALLGHVRKLGYDATRVENIRDALASDTATNAAGPGESPPGSVDTAVGAMALPSAAGQPALSAEPALARASAAKAANPRPVAQAEQSPARRAPPQQPAPAKKAAKKPAPSPKTTAKPDPWSKVIANLREHPDNRPTTRAALERHLSTLLGNGGTPEVVQALIARLESEDIVDTAQNKIEYRIPNEKQ